MTDDHAAPLKPSSRRITSRRNGSSPPCNLTGAEQLTRRLVDLATHGRRPRCGEPGGHELWCSDDATDRAQAASWCAGCAVLAECAAAADEQGERFGTWAGVDRTPAPKPRTRRQEAI